MEGKDVEGLPFAFIKAVKFKVKGQVLGSEEYSGGKPFQFAVPDGVERVVATFEFHAHYGEPQLDIPVDIKAGSGGWSQQLIIKVTLTVHLCFQNVKFWCP